MREPAGAAETAKELVNAVVRAGLEEAEAFVSIRDRRGVEVLKGSPESVSVARTAVACLRVLVKGSLAAVATTDLSPKGRSALIERARAVAGLADRDEFAVLPTGGPAIAGGEADDQLLLLDGGAMEELARRTEASAGLRGIARTHKPSFGIVAEEVAVFSTRGVDARCRRARWSLSIMAIASDREGMVSAWEGADGTLLAQVDPEAVGRSAAEAALAKRNGRRCPTGRFPVIVDPLNAISLVELVGQAASAEAVILGRSFLAGLSGRPWGAPGVTIVDDALVPGGVRSRPADDEGVPSTRLVIVGEGVVRGYLHNSRSAARMALAPTGNAVRPGPFSPPGIGVTNLALAPGDVDDLSAAAGAAIEITELLGLHSANPVTGEISVGIEGFFVEGGRRRHPVRGGALGTSVGEIFGGILALGTRSRCLGGIWAPPFLTVPLAVSG